MRHVLGLYVWVDPFFCCILIVTLLMLPHLSSTTIVIFQEVENNHVRWLSDTHKTYLPHILGSRSNLPAPLDFCLYPLHCPPPVFSVLFCLCLLVLTDDTAIHRSVEKPTSRRNRIAILTTRVKIHLQEKIDRGSKSCKKEKSGLRCQTPLQSIFTWAKMYKPGNIGLEMMFDKNESDSIHK
jgi:hypothetical protein